MKRVFGSLVTTLMFIVGCQHVEYRDAFKPMLDGQHELRKMDRIFGSEGKIQGSFFAFGGGSFNGELHPSVYVTFAWKMNNGDYALSALPLQSFVVHFEKVQIPTIKFKWHPCEYGVWEDGSVTSMRLINYVRTIEVGEAMNHVYQATLTINEKDWPIDTKLPFNSSTFRESK